MAEKGEETVDKTRVAIVSDRLEWAERVLRGFSRRVRTGPPRVMGHDRKMHEPTGRYFMCLVLFDRIRAFGKDLGMVSL
jgi:hypothetical protein